MVLKSMGLCLHSNKTLLKTSSGPDLAQRASCADPCIRGVLSLPTPDLPSMAPGSLTPLASLCPSVIQPQKGELRKNKLSLPDPTLRLCLGGAQPMRG